MTRTEIQQSAEIIQFPVGGRTGLNRSHVEAKPVSDYAMPRIATMGSGDAWYHEQAMRDDERARNS